MQIVVVLPELSDGIPPIADSGPTCSRDAPIDIDTLYTYEDNMIYNVYYGCKMVKISDINDIDLV